MLCFVFALLVVWLFRCLFDIFLSFIYLLFNLFILQLMCGSTEMGFRQYFKIFVETFRGPRNQHKTGFSANERGSERPHSQPETGVMNFCLVSLTIHPHRECQMQGTILETWRLRCKNFPQSRTKAKKFLILCESFLLPQQHFV